MIEFPFPDSTFATILADPPWKETGGGQIVRGAQRHYSLMQTPEIVAMRSEVQRVSQASAHLYLWTTNNFLPEGLEVMESWGFRYVTMITWLKDRFGLGQYFRGATEHCLFGVRGKSLPYRTLESGKRAQGVTGFSAPRGEHSAKPRQLRTMVERVSWPPYLELFAREKFPGWEVWGDGIREGAAVELPLGVADE